MATTRGALKRHATEAVDLGTQLKQNRLCDANTTSDILGHYQLEEIDYYEALKLSFNYDQTTSNADFALDVFRKANVVAKQVRKYRKLTDMHYNNSVRDVLMLIDRARAVLADPARRRRYNAIVAHKNTNVQIIFDRLMLRLEQVKKELEAATQDYAALAAAAAAKPPLAAAAAQRLARWLTAQPVQPPKRSSTLNRVLVRWTPFAQEETRGKSDIERMVREQFAQFGTIVRVYVCDSRTDSAIVEYSTAEEQRRAINESAAPSVRFTVTEYMLTEFYNSQLKSNLQARIVNVSDKIDELYRTFTNLKLRYETEFDNSLL
ncbi:hypothetical prorein [Antheraea proylei nucleopolyhedrovirus]|uniref:RRM domain-containing protein n=2 Tax=Antheraea pernyi nuclear polyhedrosis virus TaxID=161494 RepID=A0A1V1FU96_NPVAP|nr:hypothetical prorein [Antheraea proylei nucleopolyhedrovirus]AYW35446.1 hypothetical protein [Antheraea proylei nucleopolyhedrovirus]BAX08872.1 hypothetical protein [Antheraea pernyi nucleopolyhedrovirus]